MSYRFPSATIAASFTDGDRDMAIEIPGTAEDYYKEIDLPGGGKRYAANRERLRAIVSLINMEIKSVIASGGNPHTASLDLSDQFNNFISSAPAEAQVEMSQVYVEEMNAAARAVDDETNKINNKILEKEQAANSIGQWVGAGILLIFLLIIFGALK